MFFDGGFLGAESSLTTFAWDVANDEQFWNQLRQWGWDGKSGLGLDGAGMKRPVPVEHFFRTFASAFGWKREVWSLALDQIEVVYLQEKNKELKKQIAEQQKVCVLFTFISPELIFNFLGTEEARSFGGSRRRRRSGRGC